MALMTRTPTKGRPNLWKQPRALRRDEAAELAKQEKAEFTERARRPKFWGKRSQLGWQRWARKVPGSLERA